MVKKTDLRLLEKVFAKEIIGGIYQSNSKQIKRLEADGYVQKITKSHTDRFGTMTVNGYVLTFLGNATYCMEAGKLDV